MKKLLILCALFLALVSVRAFSDSELEDSDVSADETHSFSDIEDSDDEQDEENEGTLQQQVDSAIADATSTLNGGENMEPEGTTWTNEMRRAHKRASLYHIHLPVSHLPSVLAQVHALHHHIVLNAVHNHLAAQKKWRALQEKVLRYIVRIVRTIADESRRLYRNMRLNWTLLKPKGWLHKIFWKAGKYMRTQLQTMTHAAFAVKGRAGQYLRQKIDQLTRHLRQEYNDAEDADADFAHEDLEKDDDEHAIVVHHIIHAPSAKKWRMRMESLREDLKSGFDEIHDNLQRMFRFVQTAVALRNKHDRKTKKKQEKAERKAKRQHDRVRALFHSIGTFIQRLYRHINIKEKQRMMKLEEETRVHRELERAKTWARRRRNFEALKARQMREWHHVGEMKDLKYNHKKDLKNLEHVMWEQRNLAKQRELAAEATRLHTGQNRLFWAEHDLAHHYHALAHHLVSGTHVILDEDTE